MFKSTSEGLPVVRQDTASWDGISEMATETLRWRVCPSPTEGKYVARTQRAFRLTSEARKCSFLVIMLVSVAKTVCGEHGTSVPSLQ